MCRVKGHEIVRSCFLKYVCYKNRLLNIPNGATIFYKLISNLNYLFYEVHNGEELRERIGKND